MAITWNIDSWRKSIKLDAFQFLKELEHLRPPTKKSHTTTLLECITEGYRELPKTQEIQQQFIKIVL